MIGQLYGHVTLTIWKLNKKPLSPFWKNAHEVERLSLLCLLYFLKVFWHQSTLCTVINKAANSVDSDLSVFSSVQTTSLWRVLYHRRTKSLSRKLRNKRAKIHSVIYASEYSLFHRKKNWRQPLGVVLLIAFLDLVIFL